VMSIASKRDHKKFGDVLMSDQKPPSLGIRLCKQPHK
jgi:hypothetical protein